MVAADLGYTNATRGMYAVHGLFLCSEIDILGLPKIKFKQAENAIYIREGRPGVVSHVSLDTEPLWIFPDYLHLTQRGEYWVFEHIGRVRLYVNASEIWVEPLSDLPPEDLSIYILSSGLSTVMLLRGIFPLHTNVVSTGGSAIAFLGRQGAGKSTTSAHFVQSGWTLVADDVCSVRLTDDGSAFAVPGYPFVKLWPDALDRMGEDAGSLPRVMAGYEKRRWLVKAFATSDQPLKALFEVVRVPEGEALRIETVVGAEAFQSIASNAFRGPVVLAMGKEKAHFRFCSQLADSIRVYRIYRPEGQDTLDAIYEMVGKQLNEG